MNELMIVYKNNWIYFKTQESNAKSAYNDFETKCADAGINIDNMKPQKAILRNSVQEDIDEIIFN